MVAGGLQSGPPPPALSLWSGPLSGGPLVRGCLQIIREQIRKEGGKKHSGARQDPYLLGWNVRGRSPAPEARHLQPGREEGRGLGVQGREGTGWSVLDQWSLRRNLACPGGGLDTKSSPPSPALGPHMSRLALGPPQDSRRRGSEVSQDSGQGSSGLSSVEWGSKPHCLLHRTTGILPGDATCKPQRAMQREGVPGAPSLPC